MGASERGGRLKLDSCRVAVLHSVSSLAGRPWSSIVGAFIEVVPADRRTPHRTTVGLAQLGIDTKDKQGRGVAENCNKQVSKWEWGFIIATYA